MIILKNKRIFLLSLFFVILFNFAAKGQVSEDKSKSDYKGQSNIFAFGAGLIVSQDPFKAVDTKVRGFPFFFYKTKRLTVFGPRLSYLLYRVIYYTRIKTGN
jgi:hypothetical protein